MLGLPNTASEVVEDTHDGGSTKSVIPDVERRGCPKLHIRSDETFDAAPRSMWESRLFAFATASWMLLHEGPSQLAGPNEKSPRISH